MVQVARRAWGAAWSGPRKRENPGKGALLRPPPAGSELCYAWGRGATALNLPELAPDLTDRFLQLRPGSAAITNLLTGSSGEASDPDPLASTP